MERGASDLNWAEPPAIPPGMVPGMSAGAVPSPDGKPTDGDLVRQAVAGQRSAFDELIRRHQRQAVAVSYRLLGNTPDALEVTQDAFLRAYRSIETLQRPDAFGGWLLRIVSNLSLNYRRGRKHRSTLPLDDLLGGGEVDGTDRSPTGGDPVRRLQGKELGQRLQAALAQLPAKQRQALVLFTVEELPQKDVAEQLGCSVEAVKWHVFQGRKKLRELLKDELED
jgi:RNA polymerase sigma-70 factor (ECF subfamily)